MEIIVVDGSESNTSGCSRLDKYPMIASSFFAIPGGVTVELFVPYRLVNKIGDALKIVDCISIFVDAMIWTIVLFIHTFYISASMHGNYTCSVKKQKMKQPHRIHVWDLDIYLPPFSLVHVAISSPTSCRYTSTHRIHVWYIFTYTFGLNLW